jgi:DNA-directed RNA polymerase specialized sigma24 family protein
VARFETTNWSLILRAASDDDEEARLALALLCEAYWYPVYAYIRRQGSSAPDAEDLTQGYFARFLEKGVVRDVVSVRNFLNNARDRERAAKRGGGRRLLSLDADRAEERLSAEPRDPVTPETLFERNWAQTVIGRVHERLEQEAERRGATTRLARLRPFLAGSEPEGTYADIAREWGVGESAVRVALHRLRRQFAAILREEIGRTVESLAEIDDEIRYLLDVLGS